jgi:two-component system LytT family response regulator
MLSALIVDDEAPARALMIRMLGAHPEIEVIGTAASVAEAKSFIHKTAPDLVFLDLELGEQSGFVLACWLSPDTRIIFVTAYPQHALEAFGVGAVDYLVKPVDAVRLALTIERLDRSTPPAPDTLRDKIAIIDLSISSEILMIPRVNILWIEAEQNYSRVHGRFDDRSIFTNKALGSWEKDLPAESFVRISRSIVIQPSLIQALRWNDRNTTRVTFVDSQLELLLGRLPSLRLRSILRG